LQVTHIFHFDKINQSVIARHQQLTSDRPVVKAPLSAVFKFGVPTS